MAHILSLGGKHRSRERLSAGPARGRRESGTLYEIIAGLRRPDSAVGRKIDNVVQGAKMISVIVEDPRNEDATMLLSELSNELESITGNSGRGSFNIDDVVVPKSLFVIARDSEGMAIGCGSFRPINENIAEIKRMYAKVKGKGIGKEILVYLEEQAKKFGYKKLWLETRIINERAVSFYKCNGYLRVQNYGRYIDKPEAICFEKVL